MIARRVLVVDDNEAAAELFGLLVERLGHQVRVAQDGEEALRLAQEFQPEVVIMDLGMPGMDGFEAARRLRGEAWNKQPYLVALTGLSSTEDLTRAQDAGFDRHLLKPATSTDLRKLFADFDD